MGQSDYVVNNVVHIVVVCARRVGASCRALLGLRVGVAPLLRTTATQVVSSRNYNLTTLLSGPPDPLRIFPDKENR